MSAATNMRACVECLGRTWLLERLGRHLDLQRGEIFELLKLNDTDLIAAMTTDDDRISVISEREQALRSRFEAVRTAASNAGVDLLCRCDPGYPAQLTDLEAPPRVLHVAGGMNRFMQLTSGVAVAVVGTRRPTADGAAVALGLGRALSASEVIVVSGMALGIDSSAHEGAVTGGGMTLAVLPSSVVRPHPASKRRLFARILESGGVAISELGLGAVARPWTCVARNRTIAALSDLAVVVEAEQKSGSGITMRIARELGRAVGAVPGSVVRKQSDGPNALLARGATVVRNAQDALDAIYGLGAHQAAADQRPRPSAAQAQILETVRSGATSLAALQKAGIDPQTALVETSTLELNGWLRRGRGGELSVI